MIDINLLKEATTEQLLNLRNEINDVVRTREVVRYDLRRKMKGELNTTPINQIVDEVCERFGFDLRSANRLSKYSNMRFSLAYILLEDFNFTLKAIGKELGNRDHSTIINARNNVIAWLREPAKYKEFLDVYIDVKAFTNKFLM